jgi:isocitrate dehydrogenase kinase/phosphatase
MKKQKDELMNEDLTVQSSAPEQQEISTYTPPEPVSQYYTPWHELIHAKAKIDEALKLIENNERKGDDIQNELEDICRILYFRLHRLTKEIGGDFGRRD